ncbi:hypothetical protein [Paenibacillus odorifer]|uniref:hypothetical protein n=1 Tax=Paenibacillus odorifer TaxID=189426 RepID=UPI00096F354B|nr:hypothetical protein [Paenibacillus odorifer]OMD93339.1 hypothetical protein BSK67_17535 [Paenibacillus odorifer]
MITVKNIKAEYLLMSNPNFELFSEQALEKNNTLQQQKHLNKLRFSSLLLKQKMSQLGTKILELLLF